MKIKLNPVEDKLRENVYLFNIRIEYGKCFHLNLSFDVEPTDFEKCYLEVMTLSLSHDLSLFQKYQKEGKLGEHFKWLENLQTTLKPDSEVDSFTLFYYSQSREKFTVDVEDIDYLYEELLELYDENKTEEPFLAISFIEKYTMELKIKENNQKNKAIKL